MELYSASLFRVQRGTQNLVKHPKTEPSARTAKSKKPFTIPAKKPIPDVCQNPEYVSELAPKVTNVLFLNHIKYQR